jgi:glycoside/pentoside/hexuronide:cation symporter, GPH family
MTVPLPTMTSAEVPVRATPRLDVRTRLVYGIGGGADSIKMTLFGLFTLYFYTTVLGLPGTLVGIATAIGTIWDAVIDPYIGYLSDSSRPSLGRRHAFMLLGALTLGPSFWAFFSPPQGLPNVALFIWLLGTSLLVRTAFSAFSVPYYALGAEMSDDYHERATITGTRSILMFISALAAASLSFLLFFPDQAGGGDATLRYEGYPAMGLGFGAVMTLFALLATWGTFPWRFVNADAPRPRREEVAFLSNSLAALRNPSFRVLFISFSLFFLGVVLNNVLGIHFFTHYVRITDSQTLSAFQVAFYISGIVGVVVWLRVSRFVAKQRLYIMAALLTALVMLAALLVLGEGRLVGSAAVPIVLVGQALAGFFGSVFWFMPAAMIADVADEDELATGQRREGSFFGLLFFGQQVATGLALFLGGVLLDYFVKLAPGQAEQTADTVTRLGLLFSGVPALLLFIAAAAVVRYSLNDRRVIAIQNELAQRR